MGFEIRRVPRDWAHPRDAEGNYIPIHRMGYDHGDAPFYPYPQHGSTVPYTAEEATFFQVYETVTEGMPVSPVLPSRNAVAWWLKGLGFSDDVAKAFAEVGHVPSMTRMGESDQLACGFAGAPEILRSKTTIVTRAQLDAAMAHGIDPVRVVEDAAKMADRT